MTVRDMITISMGNLWRLKLRTSLTAAGVVIAIAAFVSMLSFGAGMQQNVATQFNELGLFTTMQVYPLRESERPDSSIVAVLNKESLEMISGIPGVDLTYPFDAFAVEISLLDTQITTEAQALPAAALQTRLFSKLAAGSAYRSDSTNEAMATEELLELLGIEEPDSLIGREIVVSVRVSSLDSGLVRVMKDMSADARTRFREIRFDSLMKRDYRERLIRGEVNTAIKSFVSGFLESPARIVDTLVIRGVLEDDRGHRLRVKPVVIPVATARRFGSGGFSTDPTAMMSALTSGSTLLSPEDPDSKSFSKLTINFDPAYSATSISDSIEALGFRTFSFAEQFDEIRRFFLYFNMALGAIGLIALVTASLGIVNTMVMSILERTREIGVLKSLGADERDIRLLFLFESGVIGSIGAVLGILFGWIISRIASMVAQMFMAREGVDLIELFALPFWLIAIAYLLGLIVSLAAGYYPASRAARVDPVDALRND